MAVTTLASRTVLTSVGSVLMLGISVLIMPQLTDDPEFKVLIPLFLFLIFLQLAPLLWSARADLFAPPVLGGIQACLATAATLASFFAAGTVTLGMVKGVDAREMSLIARKVLAASILGLLSYYAGYYANIGRSLRDKFPAVAGLEWDWARVRAVSVVALLAFVASYYVFQTRLGISLLDVTQLGSGKSVWRADPTLSWMIRGVQLGFLPVVLYIAWSASRGRTRHLVIAGSIMLVLAFLVARLGQRGMFLYVALCTLILFHYLRRRIPAVLFLTLLFFAMIISNVMGQWRSGTAATETESLGSLAGRPAEALTTHESDRSRFSALALVMDEFPRNHDYLLGESWVGLIATPIPRWLWPEKSQHFVWRDTKIVERLGGGPVPTGYIGVLYVNFSWIGIVIGMFLWGIFHRATYEWLLKYPNDPNVVLMYAFTLVFFGPTLLQISGTIQYVIPIWIMLRVIGRRRRAPVPPLAQTSKMAPST